MDLEYRSLHEDDERVRWYLRYAFDPEVGPGDPGGYDRLMPSLRGLFDGDDLVSVGGYHEFRARLRGANRPVSGVAAVATPPEYRRRGHVERLLRELSREFRAEGTDFSALWPFERPFYRTFGWATCNKYRVYEAPPDQLRAAAGAPAGQFRRVEPDGWETLAGVHRAHGQDYQLHVERAEEWWRGRVFTGREKDPYVYLWEDDGEPAGYVVYTVEEADAGRQLRATELAYRSEAAYRQLLRFLANHDSQVTSVRLRGPAETGLLDRVAAPEEVTCEIRAGPMLRVEDVAAGLSALNYPDVSVDVTLAVEDPLVAANAGTYRLTVESGSGECRPTDAAPEAELDTGALAQLCAGYRSAGDMAAADDLAAHDATAAALDRAYPSAEVFLREKF